MAAGEGELIGFEEEGMAWLLPSQVLDEAYETNTNTKTHKKEFQHHRNHRHHRRRHRSPADSPPLPNSKCNTRAPQRPKYPQNWGSGGPGMQAIFLDSSKKSCGTGVFLPQRAGSNFNPSNKKPACAPVLLPSRVVQALNLNVQALGLQISPKNDPKDTGDSISVKNKKGKDVSSSHCFTVISHNKNSSPELFLPKEWTY
ncbi:hypothetical protein UlMin_031411 [Ulmus minor]